MCTQTCCAKSVHISVNIQKMNYSLNTKMWQYNVDIQTIMQKQQKRAENGGGVAVYVLYMCVSQDTLCAVRSTIKHVITYDSKTITESKTPRHTQA